MIDTLHSVQGDIVDRTDTNVGISRPKRRVHPVDETFFDVIDTEAKAYWLGFLAADGGMSRRQIALSLGVRDIAHVEAFRDTLGPTIPIQIMPNGGHELARVNISSIHLCQALAALTVGPHKSFTVKPWAGPEPLQRHYWRGVFDGDGGMSTKAPPYLCLIGNEFMVKGFTEYVRGVSPGVLGDLREHKSKPAMWMYRVGGRLQIRRVAEYLYRDATVALDRKHETVEQLLLLPDRRVAKGTLPEAMRNYYASPATRPGGASSIIQA